MLISFCRQQEGVFTNLHQLKSLVLFHSHIKSIEPRVFDESANLTSLSHIDLNHNDLTELEPWPVIRAQHRPMSINFAGNSITKFTNTLQWRFNCNSTRPFETRIDLSANDIKHISDILYGWNIVEGSLHRRPLTSLFQLEDILKIGFVAACTIT